VKLSSTVVKAYGITFYKDFIGFFLLVLFFAGGMMRGSDHYLLSLAISSNLFLLSLFLLIITLYTSLQIYHFNKRNSQPSYAVFKHLTLLPQVSKYKIWLTIYITTHLLTIIYVCMVGYNTLFVNHNYMVFAGLLLYVLLIVLLYPIIVNSRLKNSFYGGRVIRSSYHFKLPYSLWFISALISNKTILFLGAKGVSIYTISLFLDTYNSVLYDFRWLLLGIFLTSFANFFIYDQKAIFESKKCDWYRSVSLKPLKKSANAVIFLLTINMMELFIICIKTPENSSITQLLVAYIFFSVGFFSWPFIKPSRKI